jgi:hypothetical protein
VFERLLKSHLGLLPVICGHVRNRVAGVLAMFAFPETNARELD